MEIRLLKERLCQDVERVCRHLLPLGRIEGKDWCVGSIHGEKGQSLRVALRGGKRGVWSDFQAGSGGDLIDLWREVHSQTLPDALTEIRAWLGVAEPDFQPRQRRSYRRPEKPEIRKADTVADYLTGERLLTVQAVTAFRVESVKGHAFRGKGGAQVVSDGYYLPYFRGDELLHWKMIGLARPDGKKLIDASANTELCLFGWQALDPNSREVAICEGEIDAMTLHQFGIPALSVPNGAASLTWIENEFENLARFEKIYLCFDADDAGRKAIEEIVTRLGRYRCFVVSLDLKDPNEYLKSGFSPEVVRAYFEEADCISPKELKGAEEYEAALLDRFSGAREGPTGYKLPWAKTWNNLRLREAELSIWTGINGHGKSQVLGHAVLELMAQDLKVCIASMEIKPDALLYRLTRQATGMRDPSEAFIRDAVNWYRGNLWLFDVTGSTKATQILDVFLYARQRYGIRVFVVDSLMKCGIAEDDYNGQKAFIEALADFKNAYDCHVCVVAHSRKGESEHRTPGKMDVKGSGAITDLADTLLSVWRNKDKEEALQVNPDNAERLQEPDGVLACSKQRNGEWEGKVALWFDKDSFQYLEGSKSGVKRYVRYFGGENA